jgi:hypothetical protein
VVVNSTLGAPGLVNVAAAKVKLVASEVALTPA